MLKILLESDRLSTRKAIFLDRDGVINRQVVGGYVTRWEEFSFLPGVLEALAELSLLPYRLIVVSNQAGVGKALMSRDDLLSITGRLVEELRARGARLDAFYYCPHRVEDNCSCRKPKTGLLRQAEQDWSLDLSECILIGDSPTDVQAAHAAGCRCVLIAPEGLPRARETPWQVVPGITEAAAILKALAGEEARRAQAAAGA